MTLAWTAFLALAGATALVLFFVAARRSPLVGAVSIAVSVVVAWEIPNPPSLVTVGGTSIYFLDILSLSMFVIAASRLSQMRRNVGASAWAWIGLGVLLLASLASGLAENPVGRAVNEFRSFLYPYAAMTWAMALVWDKKLTNNLVRRFPLAVGWLLVVVAGYHFALHGLGSTSEFVDAGTGFDQTTRPLISGQAFMILLCGVLSLWLWRKFQDRKLLFSGILFLSVAVLSQQRTVWAVGLAVAVVVFLTARLNTKVSLAFGALSVVWTGALVWAAGAIPEIIELLGNAASDSGTYDARVRSWTNLITQSTLEGPAVVLFGEPMGSGFGRYEGAGRWVEFAPHNWYVTIYLRVGVLGLFLLITFIVGVLYNLLRRRANMASVAISCAIIIYGWSYSWPWYVCIFWGWAIAHGSVGRDTSVEPTGRSLVPRYPAHLSGSETESSQL